jgi:hypothetical protein
VAVSIKVTSAPTLIFCIVNGTCLGVTCFSNSSTWTLITTIGTSADYVGKDKVQDIVVSSAPPLIGFGSSMVMIISSL